MAYDGDRFRRIFAVLVQFEYAMDRRVHVVQLVEEEGARQRAVLRVQVDAEVVQVEAGARVDRLPEGHRRQRSNCKCSKSFRQF